jgi:hypothetical protein
VVSVIVDMMNSIWGNFSLARCDEGYRCDVCGRDVEMITDSDLYLRYILGDVPLDQLHQLPERHVRCNPALAQYICSDDFEPVICTGPFDKSSLDRNYVENEENRVTQGWLRLRAIPKLGLSIAEYPLSVTPLENMQ